MRISDWSSDVCSSDLDLLGRGVPVEHTVGTIDADKGIEGAVDDPPHETLAAFERRLRHPLPSHVAAGNDDAARRQGLAAHLYDPTVRTLMLERSEEHTSELQSLMRISYAVFCLKKKNNNYT